VQTRKTSPRSGGMRTRSSGSEAARTGEEHPRKASKGVRRGARNDRVSEKDALPPEPGSPEDRGNVRRGASARL
jgi:hypothetical protein